MKKTIIPIFVLCLFFGVCAAQDVVGFEDPIDRDGAFYQEADSFQFDELLIQKVTLTEIKMPSDLEPLRSIMMPPIKVFPGMSSALPEGEELQKNEMRQPKDPEYFPTRKFYLSPPKRKSEMEK
jgi:hypothetical protein